MIVSWPNGISAQGEIRSQWHHLIDILPTLLDVARVPEPETVNGVPQQPIEGVSMRYSFDDAEAADRRRTQYFEMVGNRGIYHEGWTAVAQHGIPWQMVGGHGPFEDDRWELYDTRVDPSQAHDIADAEPERLAELQRLFQSEAERYQVLPLDDRVTERENPQIAGRLDLHGDRTEMTFGPATARLGEEAAPNVKNRSHSITADLTCATAADDGVIVAQGGRFGGWSLYCTGGRVAYAYNCYGADLTTVESETVLSPGAHRVVVEFDYQGADAEPGGPAEVRLLVDDVPVGTGHIDRTTAYYFAFDETFNVGIDRGTPVTDAYAAIDNGFGGNIARVHFTLGSASEQAETRRRQALKLADD
jgi:arylsulfatase